MEITDTVANGASTDQSPSTGYMLVSDPSTRPSRRSFVRLYAGRVVVGFGGKCRVKNPPVKD